MKRTIIAIVVIVVVGFGIYYFSFRKPAVEPSAMMPGMSMTSGDTSAPSDAEPTSGPNDSTAAPAPAPASTPAAAVVAIKNFAFAPATMSVKSGTTVTWTNDDSVAHTVTSDTGSVLNSSSIAPGQSFSFTFTTPGTYAYHCAIHPGMKATIVVTS